MLPQYLEWTAPEKFIISSIRFHARNTGQQATPVSFEVYGKEDNGAYTLVRAVNNSREWVGSEQKTFAVVSY